ncbi:hypothetical protein [Lewinella sp. IMCC34191]|uniref:hypothetical protein n=1 Tax=Lewinella sp. IMCC34191 TaxID=2259172 RepID=UPI000E27B0D4|nr:hypothetical protein [Lewinella sp. IMCC34191]
MFARLRRAVYLLLCLAIATAVFTFYYDRYLWEPNSVTPTFGGDGLTIHYNMQYHATYGEGTELTNQYYPYVESIFLTDAQAVVTVALAALRPLVPDIGSYAVGVSNSLIHWSNVLSVLILFLILRHLRLPVAAAILFGILIAMMSPQIARQLGGQYSLGYTFLIPLIIYYQLVASNRRRYWPASLGVGLVIVLLGLNNPYLFAIGAAFMLVVAAAASIVRLTGHEAYSWNATRQWVLVTLGSAVVIYAVINYLDHVDDRVMIPHGYFTNVTTWGGLLTSPGLFTYGPMRDLFPKLSAPGGEQAAYLGLIPILFAVALPALLFWMLRRGGLFTRLDRRLAVLVLGAAGVLIYAFGLPFSYFPDWTYDNLKLVLQFRSPARFTWPAYYTLSIVTAYGLYRLARRIPKRPLGAALLVVALGVWAVEANQFTYVRLYDHVHHNAFSPHDLAGSRTLAESLALDTATYSSLYLLPSEQGWSDKLFRNGKWRSNYDGYKLSLVTGIPLLNGKLTRISVQQTLASLQLISDPLVDRELLDQLPDDRAILLLTDRNNPLLAGEEGLRQNGTLLYQNQYIELRSLYPNDIRQRTDSVQAALLEGELARPETYVHVPMETSDDFAFVGNGSQRATPQWEILAEIPLDTTLRSDTLELSLWNYVDRRYFGGPIFYVNFMNDEDEWISEQRRWINDSPNTQNGWLRADFTFRAPPGTTWLRVIGEYAFPYYVDELLLRRWDTPVLLDTNGVRRLNNYVIDTRPGED